MQKNYRNLVASARFNVVFLPIGGDFHYTQVESLRQQFESYQMLFKEINSHPTWNMEVKLRRKLTISYILRLRADCGLL